MNIIVYTKTGCPWCKGVIELLNEKGVPYEERNVTASDTFRKEMERLSGQTKAPTLDIDGEIFADTDRDAVEALLLDRGVITR